MRSFLTRPSILLLGFAMAQSLSCAGEPPPLTPRPVNQGLANDAPLDPEVETRIWRVKEDRIVDGDGQEVVLRGIAFGNQVWDHVPIPSAHHSGKDLKRVADLGMNTVRFYLSYHTFEDDSAPGRYKEEGWDWLDQNVEWASLAGVRLVLNMHDPVGGYQSLGDGNELWEDADVQNRFIALWQAIAERYRAEPAIAGYDLLNEPLPTRSIDQWKDLAERTITAIRAVDQHHMIFVERVNAVGGDWSENENLNFFLVSDPNVVYEFHFYKPYHFTHQNAAWSEFAARESWYPDQSAVAVDWFQLTTRARAESDPLPQGSSDWTFLETKPFEVDNDELIVGKPFLVCDQAEGKATFDSLSLTKMAGLTPRPASLPQFGKKNQPGAKQSPDRWGEMETVFEIDLDTRRGWYFWSENGEGQAQFEPKGHGDRTAVSIAGTTGPANLGSDPLRFFLEPGATYQLHALSKGDHLAEGSRCLLRLEFYSSDVEVVPRGKEFLQLQLSAYGRWGREQGVPLYLGEFGTIRDSFNPGRGGRKWVEDMLDLALEDDLHFSYHTYHENPFGLFAGEGALPQTENLNMSLYELFVTKLGGQGGLLNSSNLVEESVEGSESFEGSDE